jgi:hypothetical protein
MTGNDLRIILNGVIHDGFDADRLTETGRKEVRAAIEKITELYDAVLASNRAARSVRRRYALHRGLESSDQDAVENESH